MTSSVMCIGAERRTPMHNIGAVTAVMAVRADALLKVTPWLHPRGRVAFRQPSDASTPRSILSILEKYEEKDAAEGGNYRTCTLSPEFQSSNV